MSPFGHRSICLDVAPEGMLLSARRGNSINCLACSIRLPRLHSETGSVGEDDAALLYLARCHGILDACKEPVQEHGVALNSVHVHRLLREKPGSVRSCVQ